MWVVGCSPEHSAGQIASRSCYVRRVSTTVWQDGQSIRENSSRPKVVTPELGWQLLTRRSSHGCASLGGKVKGHGSESPASHQPPGVHCGIK